MDPVDLSLRAVAPCPANKYGVANDTFGLSHSPCKSCAKNLVSKAGSTSYTNCTNPAGFGYGSEGANQCADGFYATQDAMQPCEQCPPCRHTGVYTPGDGTNQASIESCKVMPGCGAVPGPGPVPPAEKCPPGTYGPGDNMAVAVTSNTPCMPCASGATTMEEGSTACDGEGSGSCCHACVHACAPS